MQVGNIEYFPAELQALALMGQHPALGKRHIQPGVAIPTDHVARSALTGEGMREVAEGRQGISKGTYVAANRIAKMSDLWPRDHVGDALLVPVCRPEVSIVDSERETARPAGQAGELPAANQSVRQVRGITCEVSAGPERKLHNPVGIDLVSKIEVRNSAPCIRIKRIYQACSRSPYIATRSPAQAAGRRRDVNRL